MLIRLLLGAVLLLRPASVLPRGSGSGAVLVVRLLGARHLVEAVAVNVRPSAARARLGAAVDATHAVSALGYAATGRPHRRLALANAAGAAAMAAAGAEHGRELDAAAS